MRLSLRKTRNDRRALSVALAESSPLRRADPRVKLTLSLCTSLMVMLPIRSLIAAIVIYGALLVWARLLSAAARQIWRLKWVLLFLFLFDWLVISLELAAVITLRLILITGAFALFFATTTPGELRLVLEWMHVPYRYAFSVSLAFQSLNIMGEEWRAIIEAQRARGIRPSLRQWRRILDQVRDLVALMVPAIVMTTKRAWAMTEAAYARGFDSPRRRPSRHLRMATLDWLLLVGALAVSAALVICR
jgi:energy-coupling factor transport system permease protein